MNTISALPTQRKEIEAMPVLSTFYGIVIRMAFVRAFKPRFHAFYGPWELVVGVAPVEVIQGNAPGRVREMVVEWAGERQKELLGAWDHCRLALPPDPIPPLR
jgi:hypothetical protein